MALNGMKRGLITILILLACVARAADVFVDGVAAQVNDKSILVSDVMAFVDAQREKLKDQYSGEDLRKELRKTYSEALDVLIERELILNAYQATSKDQEKKIPEQFVSDRIESIIQDMFKGDRAEVTAALEKDGMTFEEWRNVIKNQIIVASMRRANVDQSVKASPQAIRDVYDKNMAKYKMPAKIKLRLIMLKKGETAGDMAVSEAEAEYVADKLKAGGDFAEMAKKVSQDEKAGNGGDWGWIDVNILRDELARGASQLRSGQVSNVIETDDGFYILKCDEKGEEKPLSFEEAQPQIERELKQAQSKALYDAWILRLKKSASIKMFDVCPL
jgi:parvulin-like peptidyl-prolyl isomerase